MELNNGIQHNTSIPRNTCNPQNRRYQVDISGSAVDYRQQYYKIETEISLQTFQHASTYATTGESTTLSSITVLVSALCRNPDFWLLLLVQMWSHVMWSKIRMMIQQLYDMRFQRVALISAGTC